MMTRLTSHTASDVIKKRKKAGFVFDRQAKGSHEIWYNPVTKDRTTVPNHPGKNLHVKTLSAIIKQAGLTTKEFMEL